MKKVYIIHENEEWIVPLRERFSELGTPYEAWDMDTALFDTTQEPPEGVFYNRMSASSHLRGNCFAPEYTATVLDWLELHGRRVVNDSRALVLEISKSRQYRELARVGVRVPLTRYADSEEGVLKQARDFPTPFLTKHNRAGTGAGIELFNSFEELERHIKDGRFEVSRDGVTMIQQYIKPRGDAIIRAEFIGRKFLYAVRVDVSSGFELCPADKCDIDAAQSTVNETGNKFMILENYSNPLLELYPRFMSANGIEVAGIEFLEGADGTFYTYDVNTNTNYNSDAEKLSELKGMRALAQFLTRELEALNEGS